MVLPSTMAPIVGRRERNKNEKQQRIFAAATELFAERGFESVTTQQIADRADVAVGTVFRYAASKAELLLMVYNEEYRQAIEDGRRGYLTEPDARSRLRALLTPVIEAGRRNDANTSAYQQRVLYGGAGERYRAEALELVEALQDTIAEILVEAAEAPHPSLSYAARAAAKAAAAPAARAIFAVLQLEIAQALVATVSVEQQLIDTMNQVEVVVRGYFHPAPAHDAPSANEAAIRHLEPRKEDTQ